MGNTVKIDVNTMTLGELTKAGKVCDPPQNIIGVVSDKARGGLSAEILLALAYVTLLRDNPDATLADAEAIRVIDLDTSGAAADPTEADS